MKIVSLTAAGLAAAALPGIASAQSWVTYEQDTGARLIADSNVGANDPEEKDFAWGDFDRDGDTDLVIARKQPVTTPGRKRNVLLMNEGIAEGHALNGVLVDRTAEFGSAATDGGQGMLDLTNDRDIAVVDVNLDEWPDIVTAVTYGEGLPKSISHHRIYINLGESGGQWQGFLYDEPRIPQLQDTPDACGVGYGDVNGDDAPDLYFVTYNSDFEDHLLINVQVDGEWGHFVDQTAARVNSGFASSSFGSNAQIVDMNDDGFLDIIKSENGPCDVAYNNGSGQFTQWENVFSNATYHMTVGDLNNDGLLDIIGSNDGQDRYHLNQGNGGDGMANFGSTSFSYSGSSDDGFASNSLTADLNNDGFNDVMIADVDVDVNGCGRRTHIFRNLGNLPNVTMQEQVVSGKVANIPTSLLNGTHDIAALDINGDGWKDLVIGRCAGTAVWMNQPPIGLIFQYPSGLPTFIEPETASDLVVHLEEVGDAVVNPETVQMLVSVDGAPFAPVPTVALGGGDFQGTFPAIECGTPVQFYFEAELTTGEDFFDPPTAPANTYAAMAAFGTEVVFADNVEEDVSGWIIVDDGQPGDTGLWEQAEPFPTIFNGNLAAPEEDGTGGHEAVMAFVSQNGLEEDIDVPGAADVDGGPFRLITPVLALGGQDATIVHDRWVVSDGTGAHTPDDLVTEISNDDGASWVPIPELTTNGTGSAWETVVFVVSDYVEPTDQVRLRFTISDLPNNSVTEAGIDDISVERTDCGDVETCPEDVDGNDMINVEDLVLVILAWGSDDEAADVTGNGIVDVEDLVALILAWGPCP